MEALRFANASCTRRPAAVLQNASGLVGGLRPRFSVNKTPCFEVPVGTCDCLAQGSSSIPKQVLARFSLTGGRKGDETYAMC